VSLKGGEGYAGGTGDLSYLAKVLRGPHYALVPKINRIKRQAALAAAQTVINATPFDTGRAKNNWLTSVGSTIDSEVEGTSFDRSGMAAIADAQNVIASVGDNDTQDIFITNNLPYIQRLNEGYSAQAPAGFVRMALVAAVNAIKGARVF
jgi:hypothetical protein